MSESHGSRNARRVGKYNHRRLPKLVRRQNGLCHWCQCPILQFTLEQVLHCIKLTRNSIYLEENGEIKRYQQATVDHIIPVRDGGNNEPENLVAACASCNRRRTSVRSNKPSEELLRCAECGEEKKKHMSCCWRCNLKATALFMRDHPAKFAMLPEPHQRKIEAFWRSEIS